MPSRIILIFPSAPTFSLAVSSSTMADSVSWQCRNLSSIRVCTQMACFCTSISCSWACTVVLRRTMQGAKMTLERKGWKDGWHWQWGGEAYSQVGGGHPVHGLLVGHPGCTKEID